MIDEQLLVPYYREDRRMSARHASPPRADVSGAVGVGDDRREPRLEWHSDVTIRNEPHVGVSELEAAIERRNDKVNLSRRDLIPIRSSLLLHRRLSRREG